MKKIAIIGAGPYGLIALEQLVKQVPTTTEIKLIIFDPDGPGGKVWRKNQTDQVLMNTVMQHVTLFSEDEGPNFAEWNQKEAKAYLKKADLSAEFLPELALGANDYCQRRYYSVYQSWFFEQIKKTAPKNIQIELIQEKVIGLKVQADQVIVQTTDSFQFDDVILATGQSQDELQKAEQENQQFANAHGLFYQGPGNPADTDLTRLNPEGAILIRGLGLSFFDYLALLVDHWNGSFIERNGHLIYQKTGKEQPVIVGSGRGIPYHARPNNQKRPGEEAKPQILTPEFMEGFEGNVQSFLKLIRKEAELVYYQKKLKSVEKLDLAAFLTDYRLGESEDVLEEYKIPKAQRLDWQVLLDPAKDVEPEDFQTFIQTYLSKDIEAAEQGNQTGAIGSAIDTYKELQDPWHWMLDQQKFTPKDLFEEFFGTFDREYSFLTIGAPVLRQKQLLALAEAGIITFLAPQMTVEKTDQQFIAYSKQKPAESYQATNLIEARLPATSLERTENPLLIQMREAGLLAPHNLFFEGENHFTGALKVKRETHQVIDQENQVLQHIYSYGIPLEGLDWLTAASPRPKSSDRIFYLAKKIAQSILT
ncbi:FAD/NAD(P)-binding protein [Enterococcus hailinensis]|uniref:FAD/NAD(P)-binding protein n=1 Tax=Enterococcus hailinensis TaxID=3238988 RepID=UPI0038B38077